jgi:DNA-binding transcriptional regulator GbsR (MarR family)
VDPEQRKDEEERFVEEAGLFFEHVDLPRMAGRILGRLLISVPAHQSTGELADALQASKGSISTMTRLLIQTGLAERVSLPGQRRDYFRIRPNGWFQMAQQEIVNLIAFRHTADRGLALLEGQDLALKDRLEELKDMAEFYERERPGLLERWELQRSVRKDRK